jgi:hypothetical protein
LEWRNPQLVLNMAVDKEGVPFDSIKEARAVQGYIILDPRPSTLDTEHQMINSGLVVSACTEGDNPLIAAYGPDSIPTVNHQP